MLNLCDCIGTQRKSTLLVEYKQMKKSNAFIDRRFGEDDETLTAEDRALYRYQKQRMKDLAGSKFNLPDPDDDEYSGEKLTLTHMGKSLSMDNDDDDDGIFGDVPSDDDDIDANGSLTAALHFGGGFVPSKKPRVLPESGQQEEIEAEENEEARRKTKKEVMEEVIAKSKLARAMKSQQRGEDLDATEALDAKWKELVQSSTMASLIRPKGDKGEGVPSRMDLEFDDKIFDSLTKELIFDAKARPGDRTLKPEELAELEQQRLEMLEKQRLQREKGSGKMQNLGEEAGGDDLEDDFGEIYDSNRSQKENGTMTSTISELEPKGGYAARRARIARLEAEKEASSNDGEVDSEDDLNSSEEEDGISKLEKRRQIQASGNHPLQNAFREAASKLLSKHGISEKDNSGDTSEDDASECETDEDDIENVEKEESFSDDTEDKLHSDDTKAVATYDVHANGYGQIKEKDSKLGNAETLQIKMEPKKSLSFTPALPESYEDFSNQVSDLSPDDLNEYLHRMMAFNRTLLTTDSRKKMQLLYGFMSQHFMTLAGSSNLSLPHLDVLTVQLIELTPQIPYYATTLARARLERAHDMLTNRLKDPLLRAKAWPSVRTLLFLRLLTTLFPVTDKRHPVLTAASLFASNALALCPLVNPSDIASGLLLASIAQHMHSEAKRFCPEALNFAVRLLDCVSRRTNAKDRRENSLSDKKKSNAIVSFSLAFEPSILKLHPDSRTLQISETEEIECIDLEETLLSLAVIESDNLDTENKLKSAELLFSSHRWKISALAAAVKLIRRIADVLTDIDSLPEVMAPAQQALNTILDNSASFSSLDSSNKLENKSKKQKKTKKKELITPGMESFGDDSAQEVPLPKGFLTLCRHTLQEISEIVSDVKKRRLPLCSAALMAPKEIKQYNPRFEDNYAAGKDYDPDRERAERKRLQRQLRKEERGAVRELRRDAAFMANVRDEEKTSRQAELDASARRAISFLQQQEADFKSGGQGGMWKKRKR